MRSHLNAKICHLVFGLLFRANRVVLIAQLNFIHLFWWWFMMHHFNIFRCRLTGNQFAILLVMQTHLKWCFSYSQLRILKQTSTFCSEIQHLVGEDSCIAKQTFRLNTLFDCHHFINTQSDYHHRHHHPHHHQSKRWILRPVVNGRQKSPTEG